VQTALSASRRGLRSTCRSRLVCSPSSGGRLPRAILPSLSREATLRGSCWPATGSVWGLRLL
jgi:hypothetical protein